MKPSIFDRLKIRVLIWTRNVNRRAVEGWARRTFRRQRALTSGAIELEAARDHYGAPDIPAALRVPKQMPPEAKLKLSYTLPYYYLVGLVFELYRRLPIKRASAWRRGFEWNRAFPLNEEGWQDTNSDAAFARLRVQGSNPFLLRRVDDRGGFEVDYSPYFAGIHPATVCRFRLDDDGRTLEPESISIGEETFTPGSSGWERAKLRANALDARYCVFTLHLLYSHLLVGEAFAIAAYSLPAEHALRPFMDFFTYGTLLVNDFAYKLLITPSSYFLQSKFISGADAMTLFQNSMRAFSLDSLNVPKDIAARGVDAIPGHPYVEDALAAWAVLSDAISGYVDTLYADDAALTVDDALQRWYRRLAALLPNQDITDEPLDGRARLVRVLCCLLYNNVCHEVCGDFSPFGQSQNPEHKKLVNFENMKAGNFEDDARAADVFLYDQGAFAGRFNNAGNNILTIDVDRFIQDAGLRVAVRQLQRGLQALDETLAERNKRREQPFYRMMPRFWEASISF